MKDENAPELHAKNELRQFGRNKNGVVKVVILDLTNFACIKGQAVPNDGVVENVDPDFLKLGKSYDGIRMVKQLLVDIDERYPKTEYLGIIRRDDACDAAWTCLKYMERALPRLGYKASFVDLSLPKAANGDESLVPDGFNNMNFNAKNLAKI